jgi:hypothetical protein
MTKITTCRLAFPLAAAVALASAGCRMKGLEGHWAFNEGKGRLARNSVGGNDGEVKDALEWTDGKSGKALRFNGKGYVCVPHAAYFHSPTYTISAWAKLRDVGDYQYIAWKAGPVYPEKDCLRRMDVWVHMQGHVEGIWDYVDGSAEDRGRLTGKKKITDDTWHLVVWVYDGKTMKLYIDGALDAEEKAPRPLARNEFPLWIGARPANVAATGILDEVRFFSRALTGQDIAALYERGR